MFNKDCSQTNKYYQSLNSMVTGMLGEPMLPSYKRLQGWSLLDRSMQAGIVSRIKIPIEYIQLGTLIFLNYQVMHILRLMWHLLILTVMMQVLIGFQTLLRHKALLKMLEARIPCGLVYNDTARTRWTFSSKILPELPECNTEPIWFQSGRLHWL